MLSASSLLKRPMPMDTNVGRKEKRIMVVEDDKNINRLITYNLIKNGFNPESVYNGLEAQYKLSKEIYDLVILDVMLPDIDGFRICKAIKEDSRAYKTFVIILTAKAEYEDKLYGNLLGADYYFTKPFSVEKLMGTISELIPVMERRNKRCVLA
jgi:two-component system alkaline phosphatase synthesis response regulator PhoP